MGKLSKTHYGYGYGRQLYTLCNANTNLSAFCDGTRRYVTVQKEVRNIRYRKFVLPKTGPKFTNVP